MCDKVKYSNLKKLIVINLSIMPRPILFDTISAGQTAEMINMEMKTKEHW